MMRYLPLEDSDRAEMLAKVGVKVEIVGTVRNGVLREGPLPGAAPGDGGVTAPAVSRPNATASASASMSPPISPIIIIPSVSLSFINNSTASLVVVPIMGSPPMPIAVLIPKPAFTAWSAAS